MLIFPPKTYNCTIIEPNKAAQQHLKHLLQQIEGWDTPMIFSNVDQAQKHLKVHPTQALFFNPAAPNNQPKSPTSSTTSPLHWIKELPQAPSLIIISPSSTYALDAFAYKACDYLCHPITLEQLMRATLRAQHRSNTQLRSPFVFVNVSKAMIRVVFDDILYIESMRDYIHIHTAEGAITTKMEIGKISPYLPQPFLRVHRSFIINTNKVTAYTAKDIVINHVSIPIGVTYKALLLETFEKFTWKENAEEKESPHKDAFS